MTKNGSNGSLSHRTLDELAKFDTKWGGRFNELVTKHNDMAANLAAIETMVKDIAAYTAGELGKMQGEMKATYESVGRSLGGMDMNILALAEMAKEVFGQLTQVDTLFRQLHTAFSKFVANTHSDAEGRVLELTPDDVASFNSALEIADVEVSRIKTEAEKWYQDVTASAFKTVREKLEKAEEERLTNEKRAKEEAEKVAASKAESDGIETELKGAQDIDNAISRTSSGGPGSDIPEGAEIFGG
jgi:fructose-specific phosphotransferase system component IIB